MNYFEVLELSIDDIQGQDEATIKRLVKDAKTRLYGLTTGSYANVPRSDGRTQGQWQQVLNDAEKTLIDPQKRREHIAELTRHETTEFDPKHLEHELEQERLEREREQERLEQERLERERERERLEQERLEREREQQHLEQQHLEQQRLEQLREQQRFINEMQQRLEQETHRIYSNERRGNSETHRTYSNEKRENRGCLSAILFRPLFWVFGWFSKRLIRVYTALILVGTMTLFNSLGFANYRTIQRCCAIGIIASICYYYFARKKEKRKAAETLYTIGTMTEIPQADIVPDKAGRSIMLYNQILMVPKGRGSKSRFEPFETTLYDIHYKSEILKGQFPLHLYRTVQTDEGTREERKLVRIECVYNFSERVWTISPKHIARFLEYHSL